MDDKIETAASDEAPAMTISAQRLVNDYVAARSSAYCRLKDLRKEGWGNPEGDEFFFQQRQVANQPTSSAQNTFWKMTLKIGEDLDTKTGAFDILKTSHEPYALDMGMAPGGFSAAILKKYPTAKVRAITLPKKDGGFLVQLRHQNLKLELRDINSLAGDLGLEHIPENHGAFKSLETDKLLGDELYDVAICGGKAVRDEKKGASDWKRESRRLILAQLILAMDHLKHNGTLVSVLSKAESIYTAELLSTLSSFASDIQLFKPSRAHAKRSSFYAVVRGIQPQSDAALAAVQAWKHEWQIATFGKDDERKRLAYYPVSKAEKMLEQFGETLVALGTPIWATQANALKKAPFIKSNVPGKKIQNGLSS